MTIRLDPRLNYLCDIGSRAQRRSKSSFVEWAIEQALQMVSVPGTKGWDDTEEKTVHELAGDLWDVDEPDRLAALAFFAPSLMTHEDQVIWKVARDYAHIWKGRWVDHNWDETKEEWEWTPDSYQKLVMKRFREAFDDIKKVAAGEVKLVSLPMHTITRAKKPSSGWTPNPDELDDDIPF